jgi:LPS sulfotransferase NodH
LGQNVVFVSGALRSGTTLLRLILNNHSQISNPGEFDFLFDQIGNDGTLPNINAYKDWLEGNRIFLQQHLNMGQESEVPELIRSFVKQKQTATKILTLNIHRGFEKIPPIFPDARYIHLLRDPRDVGLSSIKMGWAGNAYYGIDHWIETEKSWNRLRAVLNKDQFIEVKYEDLVSSPQEFISQICQFLKLDLEQEMFEFSKTSSYDQINQKSLYRWKNELSHQENQAIEYKISDLLNQKAYEIQSETGKKPGIIKRVGFALENRFSKYRFGLNKYGIRIFLMEKISRFLSLDRLAKSLRIEMNEINTKNLK